MANEDKKHRLKAYIYATKRIDEMIDDIETLKAKAKNVTSTISDMPKGPGTSDRTKIIDKYLDMVADLKTEMGDLKNKKREVEFLISTIDDWKIERVMRLRYVRGFKWEEVIDRMGYTKTQVFKYHRQGLELIEWGD